MGDGLGGLSTSLGLFASPPLILSTESVVVMEWKGLSTSIATRAAYRERASVDATRKHKTGTAGTHELGLSRNFDESGHDGSGSPNSILPLAIDEMTVSAATGTPWRRFWRPS